MAEERSDHGLVEARRHGIARSPEWSKIEKAHLAKSPICVACPSWKEPAHVQVHHIFPFHYCIVLGRPDLELDPRNLITLCEDSPPGIGQDHHLLLGHLDSFASGNVDTEHAATTEFHGLPAEKIRKSAAWLSKVAARLRPLDAMSSADRMALRILMDRAIPRP
jgi:hypothetical protein